MTANMKSKSILSSLFDLLSQPKINLKKVYYKHFAKEYRARDGLLKKELKTLSLQSKYMVDIYEKNRYRHLNEDIARIKGDMSREGKAIGDKLSQISDFGMRKGIFKSLKSMEFDCLANRNFYDEHTERLKKVKV